jgi:hypothetical protein
MNLTFAFERLLETGWSAAGESDLDHLPDGRPFPAIAAVRRVFERAGLTLELKMNFMFSCCRATWAPKGETVDPDHAEDERHGTVVGSCEKEAAVYALAQLRAAVQERSLLAV